jgi:hypothetical protein
MVDVFLTQQPARVAVINNKETKAYTGSVNMVLTLDDLARKRQ